MAPGLRVVAGLMLAIGCAAPAKAATLTTLWSFTLGPDGGVPQAGVTLDPTGTMLYGTTSSGGNAGQGTIFQLVIPTKKLTTLHPFTGVADAGSPHAPLVLDSVGTLYGTAFDGNSNAGTVFKIVPSTKKFTTLHAFASVIGTDGALPEAGLVFDAAGSLYGTTFAGGNGGGTVFKLSLKPLKLTTLNAFTGNGIPDGGLPLGGLVFGAGGLLYGTTSTLGPNSTDVGTLFSLDPVSKKLTTLHAFTGGNDGGKPQATLLFNSGVLYGTCSEGGAVGLGTVFKFDVASKKLTTLHSFNGGSDGAKPLANVVMGNDGMLYGTTEEGGTHSFGTVFKLNPATKKLTPIWEFAGGKGGANPYGGVVIDGNGALYGTTDKGGIHQWGAVFKLVP